MRDEHIDHHGRRYRLSRWRDSARPILDGVWQVQAWLADPMTGGMLRAALDRMGFDVARRSDAELLAELVLALESRSVFIVEEEEALSTSSTTGPHAREDPSPGEQDEASAAHGWIEIELIGEDDRPLANQRFELILPDRTIRRGVTNHLGLARFDGIRSGRCELTFPDLDASAWERL